MVFLPLCHIFGRDVAITLPLISRLVPHFGENVDDLMQTMFEVAPTALFTVPRYMQKFASQVLVGLSTTSPAKRAVYNAAMSLGRKAARRRWAGQSGAATDMMNSAARGDRLRPRAEQARPRQARTCDFGRGAAAAGDRRALADLGRQSGRGLWPDRNRRRLHLRPGRRPSRSPAMSAPSSTAGRCGSTTTARSWSRVPISSKATGISRTRRSRSSTPTNGCIPAMSANGRTAICV